MASSFLSGLRHGSSLDDRIPESFTAESDPSSSVGEGADASAGFGVLLEMRASGFIIA